MIKKVITLTAIVAVIAATVACGDKKHASRIVVKSDAPAKLATANDTLNWAMGFSLAQTMASAGITLDREVIFQAICATLDQQQQPLTEAQMATALQQLSEISYTNQSQKMQSMKQQVESEETKYFKQLTANNPNIKKSAEGVYYEVLKEGKGTKGDLGLIATFDYKGSFTNGHIFDKTYGNREPIRHVIGDPMFPGMQVALCMMTAGSHYRFYFPSALAFGPQGSADGIPANAILIYEIELHSIEK